MTIKELKNTKEWKLLTDKQQTFVLAYLETKGDILKAMHAAYNCKDDVIAKRMSYAVLKNLKVATVLGLANGETPKDTFMRILENRIQKRSISPTIVSLYKLYAEVNGWTHYKAAHLMEQMLATGIPPQAMRSLAAKARNPVKFIEDFKESKSERKKRLKREKKAAPALYDLQDFEEVRKDGTEQRTGETERESQ